MILTGMAHNGPSSPQQALALAHNPLTSRQLESVMHYVLTSTTDRYADISSRWATQNEIARLQKLQYSNDVGQALKSLGDLLSSMNIHLDLPDSSRFSSSISAQQELLSQLSPEQGKQMQIKAEIGAGKSAFSLPLDGTDYKVTVWPANGRPNINLLQWKPMWRYLAYLGLDPASAKQLAATLCDARGDAGAEFRNDLPNAAPLWRMEAQKTDRKPFDSWDQLFFVHGLAREEIDFLRAHFILHGSDGRLDPDYFSPEAMMAITGLEQRDIEQVIAYRNRGGRAKDRADITSLDSLIGVESAQIYETAFQENSQEQRYLIVTVETQGAARSLVYDRGNKQIVEWLQ